MSRVAGNHALKEVWEDNLALKLHALLDSMKVKWTSTDVVCIGNAGESSAPVILWIGVMPATLSGNDGGSEHCAQQVFKVHISWHLRDFS
jgi:hypothetical protein